VRGGLEFGILEFGIWKKLKIKYAPPDF